MVLALVGDSTITRLWLLPRAVDARARVVFGGASGSVVGFDFFAGRCALALAPEPFRVVGTDFELFLAGAFADFFAEFSAADFAVGFADFVADLAAIFADSPAADFVVADLAVFADVCSAFCAEGFPLRSADFVVADFAVFAVFAAVFEDFPLEDFVDFVVAAFADVFAAFCAEGFPLRSADFVVADFAVFVDFADVFEDFPAEEFVDFGAAAFADVFAAFCAEGFPLRCADFVVADFAVFVDFADVFEDFPAEEFVAFFAMAPCPGLDRSIPFSPPIFSRSGVPPRIAPPNLVVTRLYITTSDPGRDAPISNWEVFSLNRSTGRTATFPSSDHTRTTSGVRLWFVIRTVCRSWCEPGRNRPGPGREGGPAGRAAQPKRREGNEAGDVARPVLRPRRAA